ncbi:hypothetical protein L6452_13870 [Arctium lappa]|uniref:Uncharacterized protein n=1 Tax=Arctium lappa TaxID=4217 RepID=A0ACB9CJF4_ARCLA|nr:hypothetical protein L6452_13870 [Arctium lappa]
MGPAKVDNGPEAYKYKRSPEKPLCFVPHLLSSTFFFPFVPFSRKTTVKDGITSKHLVAIVVDDDSVTHPHKP